MTFKEQAIQDLEAVFFNGDEFAETVTYASGAVSFPCLAILGQVQFDSDGQGTVRDIRECRIKATSLTTGGISEPTAAMEGTAGDTVTVGGVTWTVSAYPAPALLAGLWTLMLERNVRMMP